MTTEPTTHEGREGVAAAERPPAAPTPRDAAHIPTTRGQRLAQDAADAADVRRWHTHPDVVALRVERVRAQVDRLCWAGIVLGLAFTMANVQGFAAAGASPWSLPWLAAWLLDPTVSLVLLAILRAEQVTARYQVHTGRWVRAAKWLALGATYVMNTWASFAAGSLAGVVLHSVPPLIVFAAAEAVTDLRDKLTEAVFVAFADATDQAPAPPTPACSSPPTPAWENPSSEAPPRSPRNRRRHPASERRKLFADYLADAPPGHQAWRSHRHGSDRPPAAHAACHPGWPPRSPPNSPTPERRTSHERHPQHNDERTGQRSGRRGEPCRRVHADGFTRRRARRPDPRR